MRLLLLLACLGLALARDSCRSCAKRAKESPNQMLCKCISKRAFCNNDLGDDVGHPGITCANDLKCRILKDCSKDNGGCRVKGILVPREEEQECGRGEKVCCNPIPGDIMEPAAETLSLRAGLITGDNPLGGGGDFDEDDPFGEDNFTEFGNDNEVGELSKRPDMAAIVNFEHGTTCGKRDSRVYHVLAGREDDQEHGEKTNPGEWPWAVLIYKGDEYVGAGVLVGPDTVVTVAHKVKKFLDSGKADSLTVRIGDFDTTTTSTSRNTLEEFPHIDRKVNCIKLHPKTKVPFKFNVAVIKLEKLRPPRLTRPKEPEEPEEPEEILAVNAISLFSFVNNDVDVESNPDKEQRQGNNPEEVFSLRAGLLADLNECFNALGADTCNDGGPEVEPEIEKFRPRVYSNTVCLPESPSQFPANKRCWLAAWGTGGQEQREIDLKLVSDEDCHDKLKPVFKRKGVRTWDLQPSERCAGGEPEKDACHGEGGAPLVCLDEELDQFFVVGLVGYTVADKCGEIPAVYTDLANPDIKDFIEEELRNKDQC